MDDQPVDEMTPQSRAARAVHLLFARPSMTTRELAESLGVEPHSIYPIMDNIGAAGIPILKLEHNCWAVDKEWLSRELGLVITNARSRGVPEL